MILCVCNVAHGEGAEVNKKESVNRLHHASQMIFMYIHALFNSLKFKYILKSCRVLVRKRASQREREMKIEHHNCTMQSWYEEIFQINYCGTCKKSRSPRKLLSCSLSALSFYIKFACFYSITGILLKKIKRGLEELEKSTKLKFNSH